MHPITFELKRQHLCAVAMGRRLFRGTPGKELEPDFDGVPDMTPARFDILYLVHKRGMIGQRELRARLGLSGATISKAIKRLAQLGLVRSAQLEGGDLRCRGVWLTDEGKRRIRRALHLVFTGRAIARHMRRFVIPYVGRRAKGLADRIDEALEDLWHRSIDLARHFGNKADLVYHFRYDSDPC